MKNPILRFKGVGQEFANWTPCALSELFDYQRPDKYIVGSEVLEFGKTPVLTANKSFIIGFTNEEDGVCDIGESIIFDDFTCDFKYVDFPFKVKSSAIKILTPKAGWSVKFLEATLKNLSYVAEGHQRHWISKVQHEFVYVPGFEEQQKIASFFSTLDKKIELNERKLEALEKLKKGIVQKIFSQEICFKNSDRMSFPKWRKVKIRDIFEISAGGDLDKTKASSTQTQDYPYPVYGNSLKNKGLFGYANYYVISGKSITVTGRGEVGHAIARNEKYIPIVRLLTLSPKVDLNVYFIAECINNTKIFVESTGVPQLTCPQIGSVEIYFPCSEEQNKIAELFILLEKKVEIVLSRINFLKQIKKGFMQQMFV